MPAYKSIIAYCRTYQAVLRVGLNFLDWTPPQVTKGPDSILKLPKIVKNNNHHSVLVVTDKGLMNLHLLDGLLNGLKEEGIEYVIYDGTQPNPTIDNVECARRLYVNHCCSAVIAVGGGSPMDCAKLTAARIARPNTSIPQMRGTLKVIKKLPTIYAVPTTAGTGSETTVAAVISNPKTHEKYPVNDPVLRPKYAILDPNLTLGLPKHITSTTGMDALTHAVEAYIGNDNTKETVEAAEKAVKLIFENLLTAYNDGKNVEARENMLEASYLAGVAFTRAYVGYVHALAHNLGGMYGTPHGLANSVILPYVLEHYGNTVYTRLAKLADIAGLDTLGMTEAQKAQLFISEIKEYNRKMDIPEHLADIKEEDIPVIAQRALHEGNPTYPVPKIMDYDEFAEILMQVGNIQV